MKRPHASNPHVMSICAPIRSLAAGGALAAVLLLPIAPDGAFAAVPYDRGVRQARELIARRSFSEADHLLTSLLREHPGNPELLSIRGRVRLWAGDPGAAVRDLRQSLRRRENDTVRADLEKAETAEQLAEATALLARGERDGAEQMLVALFDSGRSRYDAGLMLGRLYASSGEGEKAQDLYRALHAEFPREHDITLHFIRALIRAGNTERAEQEAALLPDEEHPSLHLARAAVIMTRKEYPEALEHYRQALRLREDPDVRRETEALEALIALKRADVAIASGQSGTAEAILRPLYEDGRNRYDAGHRLARIAAQRQEFGKATAIYRRLAEEFPGDGDTICAYLDTLLAAGEVEGANALIATLPGDSPSIRLRRARILSRLSRFSEAVEEYRRLSADTSDPSVAGELARAERAATLWSAERFAAEGNVAEAERLWQELFSSGKERYESGTRLAKLFQQRREFGRAAGILSELRRDFPAETDLPLAHLDALLADGNLAEAQRELAALPVDDDPRLLLRRARLAYRMKRYEESVRDFLSAGDSLEPTVAQEREAAETALALHRAVTLMRAGKLDEAIALWNELFGSGRERYESGYQLGMAYLRRREFTRAREHFTVLSAEYPSDPGLYALAAESHLLAGEPEQAAALVRGAAPERAAYLAREREDLLYRVRSNYIAVSGLVAGYDRTHPVGREAAVTLSQRIPPATLLINAALANRFGEDDTEFGAELGFPVATRPSLHGTLAFSFSPDANFLPRTTFRGELSRPFGGLEASLGYMRMDFRNSGVNIAVVGLLGYIAPTLTLSERLYTVPDRGSFSLLSTLHYEPGHRLRGFYSLGVGTASEQLREAGDLERFFTLTNRIGAEYRPVASVSGGAELFHEYRESLYSRYGTRLFVKYWW